MVTSKIDFGEKIKRLREDRNFSQRQFALQLDITPTYMSKIERGELPPPSEEVVKKMAQLLGCNSDELLADADKVDSDLLAIIKDNPKAVAALLRKREKH